MKLFIVVFVFLAVLSSLGFAQEVMPETMPTLEEQAPAIPLWAETFIIGLQQLPVVGPIISTILVWTGVISTIATAFVAFLLTTINALSRVFNLVGLLGLVAKLELVKNSRVLYWLASASIFNAKKPGPK